MTVRADDRRCVPHRDAAVQSQWRAIAEIDSSMKFTAALSLFHFYKKERLLPQPALVVDAVRIGGN